MNTVQSPDLNAILETASTQALTDLLDASYDDTAMTVTLEPSEDESVDAELESLLGDCGLIQTEDAWQFADAQTLQAFMALVQTLAPEESGTPESGIGAGEGEYIVFNNLPLTQPESLPEQASESLELETKGYTLRRIPPADIRIEPVNNPRSRTATAGAS